MTEKTNASQTSEDLLLVFWVERRLEKTRTMHSE